MKKTNDPRRNDINSRKARMYNVMETRNKPNMRFYAVKVTIKGVEYYLEPADYSDLLPLLHKEIIVSTLADDQAIAKVWMDRYANSLIDNSDSNGRKIDSMAVVKIEGTFSIVEKMKYKA